MIYPLCANDSALRSPSSDRTRIRWARVRSRSTRCAVRYRGTFRYPDPRGIVAEDRAGVASRRRRRSHCARQRLARAPDAACAVFRRCRALDRVFAISDSRCFRSRRPLPGRSRCACRHFATRSSERCPTGTISMRWPGAIRADTRIVYLANPNNPTGTWFDDAALDRFVARVPRDVLIVVDEAYSEYVDAAGLTIGVAPGRSASKPDRYADVFEGVCAWRDCASAISSRIRVSSRCSNDCANRSTSTSSRSPRRRPRLPMPGTWRRCAHSIRPSVDGLSKD